MNIAQDLLQAAERIDSGEVDFFCCFVISTETALDFFKSLFEPTPNEGGDRCITAWMTCWSDTDYGEKRLRRVLALLLAREIWLDEQRRAR